MKRRLVALMPGPQYMSDHFGKQLEFWGIKPSFVFVHEPETNGVAERFNRTLKEQAIYGRVFRNVEEVREAVRRFVEIYNGHWRLEKLGYLTPERSPGKLWFGEGGMSCKLVTKVPGAVHSVLIT